MKRAKLSALFALVYALGFWLAWLAAWADLPDRFLWLESVVAGGGHLLLYSLYAPITLSGLLGSAWMWPAILCIGFLLSWGILALLGSCGMKGKTQ